MPEAPGKVHAPGIFPTAGGRTFPACGGRRRGTYSERLSGTSLNDWEIAGVTCKDCLEGLDRRDFMCGQRIRWWVRANLYAGAGNG